MNDDVDCLFRIVSYRIVYCILLAEEITYTAILLDMYAHVRAFKLMLLIVCIVSYIDILLAEENTRTAIFLVMHTHAPLGVVVLQT